MTVGVVKNWQVSCVVSLVGVAISDARVLMVMNMLLLTPQA